MNEKKLIIIWLIVFAVVNLFTPAAVIAQSNITAANITSTENEETAAASASISIPEDKTAGLDVKKENAALAAEDKITLDLKGVDILELFKILSTKTGLTITATPQVTGRVTLSLDNVDFNEALKLIRKQLGLASVRKNNTVNVMTRQEFLVFRKQQAQEAAKNKKSKTENYEAMPKADMAINKEAAVMKSDEKITLDLNGVDLGELFKMLSIKSGLTIITAPQVKGRLSVFLNNLSFDDALDVILTLGDLACERNDKLIKVMTAAEYEQLFGKKFSERRKVKTIKLMYGKPINISNVISSLKSEVGKIIVDEASGTIILIDTPAALVFMEGAIKELDVPLETAVFDINYANPVDIKAYITDLVTPGVGQLIIDQRSNKLIVSDLPQRLAKIKKLMVEFDEASRQVLITGEIIQVTLNNKSQRGIDWEVALSGKNLHSLDFVGKFPLASTLSNYGKLSVGTLSNDDYTAVLNILQEYGKVDVLSRPQVVAVNKEEARILVGSREPYVTQQQSQAQASTVTSETVEFIDVGVKLKVVPTIGKDGFITMKIKPEISSVRETFTTVAGSQIPIVETSETETVVKVKDGAMIMLGGLIRKERRDTENGVPFLSRLPFLGNLFGSKTKEEIKSELVIFLTPRLMSGDIKLAAEGYEK